LGLLSPTWSLYLTDWYFQQSPEFLTNQPWPSKGSFLCNQRVRKAISSHSKASSFRKLSPIQRTYMELLLHSFIRRCEKLTCRRRRMALVRPGCPGPVSGGSGTCPSRAPHGRRGLSQSGSPASRKNALHPLRRKEGEIARILTDVRAVIERNSLLQSRVTAIPLLLNSVRYAPPIQIRSWILSKMQLQVLFWLPEWLSICQRSAGNASGNYSLESCISLSTKPRCAFLGFCDQKGLRKGDEIHSCRRSKSQVFEQGTKP
jgi:hypothetical protein